MKPRSDVYYGIACGSTMSAWVLIEYALGFHTTSLEIGQYSGFVSFIFPIVFIFVAIHDRQSASLSKISWFDGINTGFRISFFAALFFTIFYIVYVNVINPEWLSATIEWQRKQLILSGASDDDIGKFMDQNRQMNSPLAQLIVGFISVTGLGVLVTLIEIPIVRKLFKNS